MVIDLIEATYAIGFQAKAVFSWSFCQATIHRILRTW